MDYFTLFVIQTYVIVGFLKGWLQGLLAALVFAAIVVGAALVRIGLLAIASRGTSITI